MSTSSAWNLISQNGAKFSNFVRQFFSNRQGNIAITFAIVLVPLLAAVGASLDYARAYNAKIKMQSDLDAALLGATRKIGVDSESDIRAFIKTWFAAQTDLGDGSYTLRDSDIIVDKAGVSVTANLSTSIPTTLMRVVGVDEVPISAISTVQGSGMSFVNIYIVLDKSASMLLAADTTGQSALTNSPSNCVFACHDNVLPVEVGWGRNKTSYTKYEYARMLGVTLRTDVQLQATEKVLDMVSSANNPTNHIKVGFYTLGTNTTGTNLLSSRYNTANGLHEVLSPTYSSTKLSNTLSGSSELSSDTSYYSSDFRSLQDLTDYVGESGSGTSENDPLKLVMLITDGAQSSIDFLGSQSGFKYITAMNPGWCDAVKDKGAEFAVLYTEYLPVPAANAFSGHYYDSLGKNMASSNFRSKWNGVLNNKYNSTSRRDFIEKALEDCASKSQYFIAANDQNEIVEGFQSLLTSYLAAVRLTQ